jgi:hypothetical protein
MEEDAQEKIVALGGTGWVEVMRSPAVSGKAGYPWKS